MINYNRGDVVLVLFPFSDQTTKKQRPAVVLSIDDYNRGEDLIISAITSKFKKPLSIGDCKIINWKEAGLLKPSIVKAMITTVEKSLVIRKLGKIQNIDMENINKSLGKVLGFI